MPSRSFLLNTVNLFRRRQTITAYNTIKHCRVRLYTFVGQGLLKQLYTDWLITPAFDTIGLPPSAVGFAV